MEIKPTHRSQLVLRLVRELANRFEYLAVHVDEGGANVALHVHVSSMAQANLWMTGVRAHWIRVSLVPKSCPGGGLCGFEALCALQLCTCTLARCWHQRTFRD